MTYLLCIYFVVLCGVVSTTLAGNDGRLSNGGFATAMSRLGFLEADHIFEERLSVLNGQSSVKENCTKACETLADFLPEKVDIPGSEGYKVEGSSYWSNIQAEQKPYCYITPSTPKEVAGSILVAEQTNCSFAVRSGGHAAFAGASNIQNGFTIDLRGFKEVTVSQDRKTTRVGPGNRWVDVYQPLSNMGLAVIGGRVSAIGVGGLTLGGGISFFSGRYGWACDNVRNYEVVLGGGQILDVNYTSYPDLYYALRGGGNNFGVVTRFDLVTFNQSRMWGGSVFYDFSQKKALITALYNFAYNAPDSPDAATFVAFAYTQGQFFGNGAFEYAKPIVNPPIFHEFTSIANLSSTMRITTLPNITLELNTDNPTGLRETYTTATFVLNAKLMEDMLSIFAEEVKLLSDVDQYLPALLYQVIPENQIKHFSKNGGNALGIGESDAPLLLLNISVMWASADDDARVINNTNSITQRCIELSKKRGLSNRYLYQNYASLNQEVFQSYGKANYDKLVSISKKYDPDRIFQRLQPGYFKLTKPNGASPAE